MTNQSRRVRRKGAVPSRKMASKCERVDRISKLPDDILVSVISRLTVAEATSTSILSTRWRHLHTLIHRLVFCPSQQQISRIRKKHPKKLLAQIKEFTEYMKVIDGVLDSYVGILEEFRVDLPCLLGANMNKWLQFALERKVESIGIHIMSNNKLTTRDPHALMRYGGYYHFPRSALRNNAVVPGLESLKQLSLRGVHVQERDVSLFLLSLTGLESLSISFSEKLRKVRALGHSKLKILYISSCKNVESIEVSDMNNLASLICPDLGRFDQLRYQVLMPQLKLNNLPNLIHFEISDRRDQSLIDILPTIPSCIRNQLLHLKLTTDPSFIRLTSLENYKFHRFENLKHLELDIFMQCNKYSVRRLIPMISACPLLETIEIKFLWRGSTILFEDRKPKYLNAYPNHHIKRVKISGYLGSCYETELFSNVIKKAVEIQELIVEPQANTHKLRVQRRCTIIPHLSQTRTPDLSDIEYLLVSSVMRE